MGSKALGELCTFSRGASVPRARMYEQGDYLYIHFPDGYAFSTDISFLTRVSAEVKYFAKCIRVSLGIQKP